MHLSPKERVGYVALGAILLVGVGFVGVQKLKRPATIELHETSRPPVHFEASTPSRQTEPVHGQEIVVDVTGAVKYPGLVTVPAGSRVFDAIAQAGGPTSEANIDAVNLAAKAIDGTQIIVPTLGGSTAMNGSLGGTGIAASGARRSSKVPPSIMDLNSASTDQLQTLPGVGKSMAQRVVDFRSTHGPFRVVDDLLAVQGFGKKRLEQVRPWLVVQ